MKGGANERVFLVRMWRPENTGSDTAPWRGSIQEVDSGLRVYVVDPRDIADFIAARLALNAGPGDG